MMNSILLPVICYILQKYGPLFYIKLKSKLIITNKRRIIKTVTNSTGYETDLI